MCLTKERELGPAAVQTWSPCPAVGPSGSPGAPREQKQVLRPSPSLSADPLVGVAPAAEALSGPGLGDCVSRTPPSP